MSRTPEQTCVTDGVALLKVAGRSDVSSVAGAAVKYMAEGNKVELSAIGAGAVNQAIKAVATARGMTATSGRDLCCVPYFRDEEVTTHGVTSIKTAMILRIIDRLNG